MSRRAAVRAALAGVATAALSRRASATAPNARPTPSPAQLAWQRAELAMFTHFGVNTFTDREWGDGTESPHIFNPVRLDARQWARAAKRAGFASIVLTAKHHDGFCLWPSAHTKHSVASAPWRDGQGDVVREVANACSAEQIGLGLYLSPWDRHEAKYGSGAPYMDYYCAQLEELLTNYGPVVEVWFDGANGEGPNAKRQAYDWPRIHALVRRLQPSAVMFSDAGPDVRWIGNEKGVAGETCWSTIDPASVPYAGYDAPNVGDVLQRGDRDGSVWRPGETDVSIRPGWFYHTHEDEKVRSARDVMELYFSSVGRNSKLLLNVPPTRDGLLHATDVESIRAFGDSRRLLLEHDLARSAKVTGAGRSAHSLVDGNPDSHWRAAEGDANAVLELELKHAVTCNVVRLQEAIAFGQSIEQWTLSAETQGAWRDVARGTTIGCTRLARFDAISARRWRLSMSSSLATLRLATLGLHFISA